MSDVRGVSTTISVVIQSIHVPSKCDWRCRFRPELSAASASASGIVCALGVVDQSRAGATAVHIGGGEAGLSVDSYPSD